MGSAGSPPRSSRKISASRASSRLSVQDERDAGRQGGFQVLEAVDGEVHAAVEQRLVKLLGEQPLAADLGQAAVLHAVAGGAEGVLLEGVHAVQHGAEAGELVQERAGLGPRERGSARSHAQRQRAVVVRPDARRGVRRVAEIGGEVEVHGHLRQAVLKGALRRTMVRFRTAANETQAR